MLDAITRSQGVDKSEIVREVIHQWATSKIDEARLMHRLLQAEGLPGIHEGIGRLTRGSSSS